MDTSKKTENPEQSVLSRSEKELSWLFQNVAKQRAGIRNAASEDEIEVVELLEKMMKADLQGNAILSARRLIQEVRNMFLARNIILLGTAIPICLVVLNQGFLAWSFLVIWIGLGSWSLALSQRDNYFQLDNISQALQSLDRRINKPHSGAREQTSAAVIAMSMYQRASNEITNGNYDKAILDFDRVHAFITNNLDLFDISQSQFGKFREQILERVNQFDHDVLPQEILDLREELRGSLRETYQDMHGEIYGILVDVFLAEVLVNAKKKADLQNKQQLQ